MNYAYKNVVNLTGRSVTALQWDGKEVVLEPAGRLRVDSDMRIAGVLFVDGLDVPLLEISEKEVRLPDEIEGTVYIVSGIVAARAKRDDFVVPARVVRDANGRVVGCRAFARLRL